MDLATWAFCQWIAGERDDGRPPVSAFDRMRRLWPAAISSGRILQGQRRTLARLLKMRTLTGDVERDLLFELGMFVSRNPPEGLRVNCSLVARHLNDTRAAVNSLSALLLTDSAAVRDQTDLQAAVSAEHAVAKLLAAASTTRIPCDPSNPSLVMLTGGTQLWYDAQRVLDALEAAAARALTRPRRARPTTREGLRHFINSLATIYEARRSEPVYTRDREHAVLSADFFRLAKLLLAALLNAFPVPGGPGCSDYFMTDQALRKQITASLKAAEHTTKRAAAL